MNLQTSNRRQELPVRLGNHGYRLDGDYAWLNAELHVPPYSSGNLGLELWACAAPLAEGGAPEGIKVAEIPLDLPTPINSHLHRVEARAPLSLPLGNADHSMVLMLVERGGDSGRVHDFANYRQLQHIANPSFRGAVGYSIDGDQVSLRAESVANPRSEGNSTGTLSVELWALSEPYVSGAPRGQRLAGAELGSVWGQYQLTDVERRASFTAPAAGRWQLALLLREWTLENGYVTRDYRSFDATYERAAAEPAASVAPPPSAATQAAEKLRLIKPATAENNTATAAPVPAPAAAQPLAAPAPASAAKAPAAPASVATPSSAAKAPAAPASVATPAPATAKAAAAAAPPAPVAATAPAPVAAAATATAAAPASAAAKTPAVAAPAAAAAAPVTGSRLVSIQTGSLDELSRLPGLSLKVAKEIVKQRPYASVDALVDVRGVGEKTLRRIKSLITL
jgi:DNA uptake protein ComE-like DNA-binding protein